MLKQSCARPDAALPILSVSGLRVVFPSIDGDSVAVEDVSFDIAPGETLAIVGESGSGKSVTAKAIMRLVEFAGGRIDAGTIVMRSGGEPFEMTAIPERTLRTLRGKAVSLIFQEPMTSLNPVLTIGQQIGEALEFHEGLRGAELRERTLTALRQVRIPEPEKRLTQYPHELSGGMRQRVMIAMALACRPSLLIADEPTTALDVTIQAEILALIKALQAEIRMSVLFITHDMGVVAEIADRVMVMRNGRKIEEGPVETIFAAPERAYTKALLAAVPRLGSMAGKAGPERFATPLDAQDGRPAYDAREIRIIEGAPTLQVDRLSVRFPVHKGLLKSTVAYVHAVEDVSFKLFPGETLALVGESGSGKSTTGRSILKLVEPTGGDIIVRGKNITNYSQTLMRDVRNNIQMIFQDPFASLNPRMTVEQIVAEPMRIRGGMTRSEIRERVVDLLKRVGVGADALGRYSFEFSGGQRQRICIARALALNPSIVIADEAVSALDVSIRAQVINLMMELQDELGISYLFISHDIAVVEQVSHRIAVMYLGEIVEIGPREAVISNPSHPYTQRLLEAVPVADPTRRRTRALAATEIGSAMRPVDYVPPKRAMHEVSDGHFVQVLQ